MIGAGQRRDEDLIMRVLYNRRYDAVAAFYPAESPSPDKEASATKKTGEAPKTGESFRTAAQELTKVVAGRAGQKPATAVSGKTVCVWVEGKDSVGAYKQDTCTGLKTYKEERP